MPVPWLGSDQYDRKIQMVGRISPDEMHVVERCFAAVLAVAL